MVIFLVINEERMTDVLELLGGDLITTSSMCLLDHTLADIGSGEDYYYNTLVFLTCQYVAAHSLF